MQKKKTKKRQTKRKIIEETTKQVGHVKHIILKMEQVKVYGILDMRYIY